MTPVKMVAVGASLGGLAAVRAILNALPKTFAPTVTLAQHRRPDADSRLPELLGSVCALPVIEPEDKERVAGGHVYVAPANYHLLVSEGVFWLSVDPPVNHARPSIDVLFESVAETYGPAAVAVVLTGSSDDGADGTVAIKRAGGTVLVQDPRSAESPVLPKAAIAGGQVDAILPLPALARELVALVEARGRDGTLSRQRPRESRTEVLKPSARSRSNGRRP